ncbi:hypothetical protein F5Y08DRAFT_291577 [Xylaria arbuscula]|nr:hypothetical protein F5Y08DRAFT_291577 [Xylaria arbuscula]
MNIDSLDVVDEALRGMNIQDWGDIYDEDDEYDDFEPDPMEIESAEEQRRQLDGVKADLAMKALEESRARSLLGEGVLATFDYDVAELPDTDQPPKMRDAARFPECALKRNRKKPVSASARVDHLFMRENSPLVEAF